MENNIDQMLIERIKSAFGRRMVFFVGAGISVPSAVPDFKRLNEEVIQSISGDELDMEDCDFLTENVRPEVMYQIAMDELCSAKDKLGTEVLFSLETFERCEPNCYHYFLAEAILDSCSMRDQCFTLLHETSDCLLRCQQLTRVRMRKS